MSETTPEGGAENGFLSHLVELRGRLLKAIAAVLVVLVVLLPFANDLYGILAKPLVEQLPGDGRMIAIEVASPFLIPLKLAAVVALLLAMPVVLYQLWAFVSPGLYRHEKRLAKPLLVASVLLFYAGCAFAFFFVLPNVFRFLAAMTPEGVEMATDISHYLSFVLAMFLAFGLSFEVPVATVIVAAMGWVSPAQLAESRGYILIGCFAIAAVLTPPDVLSMILLAVPMYLLYEAGLLAARILIRTPLPQDDAADPNQPPN